MLVAFLLPISFLLGNGLSAGDILFVGFNADDVDGFAFIAMTDIPDGTVIYFTDNEWNGTVFNSGEGFITWTNTTGTALPTNSVVTIDRTNTTPQSTCGSVSKSGSNFDIAGSDEVIYAYCGSDVNTPTTFLTAIANNGFSTSSGELIGTGLTVTVTAIQFFGLDTNADVATYKGSGNIASPLNWLTDNGIGDQNLDGLNADFPSSLPVVGNGCNQVLPVEFSSFSVKVQDRDVLVEWTTASEVNNDFFEVEWSDDSRRFEPIGVIDGAGTSDGTKSYRFVHINAPSGISFYRIKQVDFNGAYSYSTTKNIRIGDIGSTRVYPTTVRDQITIEFPNSDANIDVDIYSMDGRKIKSMIFDGATLIKTIPIDFLSNGMYIIRTRVDYITHSHRIFVQ